MFAIPKSKSEDPFYRYKRDKIKITKTGSDSKSYSKMKYHWKNFEKIMKQTGINVQHFVAKYKKFCKQNFEIANGMLSFKSLAPQLIDYEDFLEAYILKYVCCDVCMYPELDNSEPPVCKSCGAVKK